MVVSMNGNCYSGGPNQYGQLGRGENNISVRDYTPKQIPIPFNHKITQISSGYFHCLALSTSGSCFSWGKNEYGELGIPNLGKMINRPILVESLQDKQITYVSSGGSYSLAIGSGGTCCYSWGLNDCGKLGLGFNFKATYYDTPQKINIYLEQQFESENQSEPSLQEGMDYVTGETISIREFVCISAGYYHSLVVTRDGKCYQWGYYQYSPKRVGEILLNKKITWGTSGYLHCLVTDETGHCFGWGINTQCQLGPIYGEICKTHYRKLPLEIHGPWFEEGGLIKVESFHNHCVGFSKSGNVFEWGLHNGIRKKQTFIT